ncbi:hypothetical protein L195_g023860, partial [Trifolium pratense]
VWGWGYGGEGQLGLGSRVKMVSSPHLIPCIESASGKDKSSFNQGSSALVQCSNGPGSYVTEIACGGRHSALVTDAGVLLTFGCGVCMGRVEVGTGEYSPTLCSPPSCYPSSRLCSRGAPSMTVLVPCGQGDNADHLRPTLVPSLLGTRVKQIAAGLLGTRVKQIAVGLWHTLCVTVNGQVYAFGGKQFGQLGTGSDQPEGADNSILYGCCVLVEEIMHKPSGLISMVSDKASIF